VGTSILNGISNATGFIGKAFGADWNFYDKNKMKDEHKNKIAFDVVENAGGILIKKTKTSAANIDIKNNIIPGDFYDIDEKFICPDQLYAKYEEFDMSTNQHNRSKSPINMNKRKGGLYINENRKN